MSADLYNEAIIAEAKAKFGEGRLEQFDREVTQDNPLCGDRVKLQVEFDGERIIELAHRTRGCLLTAATMSILARHAKGASKQEISAMHDKVRALLLSEPVEGLWSELAMLAPVASVKSRHECVLLPFEALENTFD